eukprot:GILJ01005398.1.p1 GENE.GILJ01005398.1~~GILJ01005398.1.p1  ORF type:complete len:707 (-),score=92.82 GILJ01005398.1:105-2225(-)
MSEELTTFMLELRTARDSPKYGLNTISVRLVFANGTFTAAYPLGNDYWAGDETNNFKPGNLDRFLFQSPEFAPQNLSQVVLILGSGKQFVENLVIETAELVSLKFKDRWTLSVNNERSPEQALRVSGLQTYNRTLLAGPILCFNNCEFNRLWRVSVLAVTQAVSTPPVVTVSIAGSAAGELQAETLPYCPYQTAMCWKWQIAVPMTSVEQLVSYSIHFNGVTESYQFLTPAQHQLPRVSYTSCSGLYELSGIPDMGQRAMRENEMYSNLYRQHQANRYHFIIKGGDQVYADGIWAAVTELQQFALERNDAVRRSHQFSPTMDTGSRKFYFDLYLFQWTQPELQPVLASIPLVCMWDDHDIFDGWGSYPDHDQACSVLQGVFKASRDMFELFQLHCFTETRICESSIYQHNRFITYGEALTTTPRESFTYAFCVGPMAVLVPDLRSERTATQVISDTTRHAMYQWISNVSATANTIQYLAFVSSVPMLYVDIRTAERLIDAVPGRLNADDDLRDQWGSYAHFTERNDMLLSFLNWAKQKDFRVLILSGDIHLASRGVVVEEGAARNTAIIHQWTSSGVVSLPPSNLFVTGVNRFLCHKAKVGPNVHAELLDLRADESRRTASGKSKRHKFRSHGAASDSERLVNSRNFLSILPDGRGGLKGTWFCEDPASPMQPREYTVTLLPPGPFSSSRKELEGGGGLHHCCTLN